MGRWRSGIRTVWMWAKEKQQILSWRRCATGVTVVLILAMVVGLPASLPTPAKAGEERFGPIHWYEPLE